ncbi:hypothetical protein, partial [Enterovibrio paralichthyis]|uniref:hypothetical protein n=1 Tax=Enterovibrio paralichthyis TaxID=2853805 RepID=UPI001C44ECA4
SSIRILAQRILFCFVSAFKKAEAKRIDCADNSEEFRLVTQFVDKSFCLSMTSAHTDCIGQIVKER